MKMQVRSYRVFLSRLYLWGMLLLLPVVLILANMALERYLGLISVLVCYWIYIFVDVLADFWVFGGICSKNSSKMDYVKSSYYGYKVVKSGIMADMVRRLVWMTFMSLGLMGYILVSRKKPFTQQELLYIGIMILLPYVVNTATLNITRYIEAFQLYLMVPSVGTGFSIGALSAFGIQVLAEPVNLGKYRMIVMVLAILAVAVTLVTIRHMLYKVKHSYRDVS